MWTHQVGSQQLLTAHLWLLLLLEDVGCLDVALDVVNLDTHSPELPPHVPAKQQQDVMTSLYM